MKSRYPVVAAALLIVACDDKTTAAPDAAPAMPSAAPSMTASAAPSVTASAAPSAEPASSSSMVTGAGTDDVMLTVKDPTKDAEKSVTAKTGGAFTLFLPDANGTTWAADSAGSLGKAKEEMIPGFAPQTLGHQFKWTGLKAGKTTLKFGLRKVGTKGGAPSQTFTLNLEVN